MADQYPLTDPECGSCGETQGNECARSERRCGHHCNHVWEHDECCWCKTTFGEGGKPSTPIEILAEVEAAAESIYAAWSRPGQSYWETLLTKETYRRLARAAISAARRISQGSSEGVEERG